METQPVEPWWNHTADTLWDFLIHAHFNGKHRIRRCIRTHSKTSSALLSIFTFESLQQVSANVPARCLKVGERCERFHLESLLDFVRSVESRRGQS